MKLSKQPLATIIFISSIVAIIIPFIIYFTSFKGGPSNSSQEWANFSTFWVSFISLANTIAILYLTYYFQKYESDRNSILERPIISISQKEDRTSYKISNVGKGSALNIKAYCSIKADYDNNFFTEKRICYSLTSNESFDRSWLNGHLIIIEYTDIFNNKFYSMMENDTLHVFDHNYNLLVESTQSRTINIAAKFKEYMKWDISHPTWP